MLPFVPPKYALEHEPAHCYYWLRHADSPLQPVASPAMGHWGTCPPRLPPRLPTIHF